MRKSRCSSSTSTVSYRRSIISGSVPEMVLPLSVVLFPLPQAAQAKSSVSASRSAVSFWGFLKNSVGTVEIPKDQSAYYFGVENLDFEEAVASEPFINAIAFSVCLMRVKDGTDIDELKAEIRRSANPAKWICVDVNPNDVRVESVGDLVLLIMADDSEKYSEAFYALAE